MSVETREFEFSHGRRPRGGPGSWAFSIRRNPTPAEIFWIHGAMYSEAKRQAVRHFGRGVTIYVQP